jgi:hypothetical protein
MKTTTENTVQLETDKCHCTFEFIRLGETNELYPVYNLRLTITPWLRQIIESMTLSDGLQLARGARKIFKEWAQQHPHCFLTLYENYLLYRFLTNLGLVCDGRLDTYIAYVDAQGNFTSFPKMLNLVKEEHLYINELWRLIKDCPQYYEGEFFNPVTRFAKLIHSAGLGGDRPHIIIEQNNSNFIQSFLEKIQGQKGMKVICDYSLPLGGSGWLRASGLGSNQVSIWVVRKGTRMAIIHEDYIHVEGFVVSQNEEIRYELTPEIAKVIVMAINDIDLEQCSVIPH